MLNSSFQIVYNQWSSEEENFSLKTFCSGETVYVLYSKFSTCGGDYLVCTWIGHENNVFNMSIIK